MSRRWNYRATSFASAAALGIALSACGGGGGGSSQPPPPPPASTYTVGGTVTGLAGSGLTIRNGSVDLPITASGNFTFTTQLASGAAYAVSVVTQPSIPAQTCAVANGSGTIGSANVSNVTITCTTTPLTLASSTPANNATGIDRTGNLALVFSAPLDPASVAGNVTLQSASGQVAVSASVSGSTLTIDPQIDLALLTNHTLTVATGFRGSAGEPLAAAVTLQFRTADGTWKAARLLETSNAGHAYATQISMNANGSAVVVWQQDDGARSNIWSSRFVPGSDWTPAELIENSVNSGEAPDVAVDAEGNAIAVWAQFDGLRRIWSNRYTPGAGWGAAQTLQPAGIVLGNSLFPHVAVDGAGNAMAVWWAFDDSDLQIARTSIWSNRYTRSGGWATEELASASLFNSVEAQVAMDAGGNAFTVWNATASTNGMTGGNIYTNRATPATGWGAHERIDATATSGSRLPQIAVDGSGNAIAVWQRGQAGIASIWSARYETDGGWGLGQVIDADSTHSAFAPQIAVTPTGEAFAIWRQYDGTRENIWSNRYTRAGWSGPELVETSSGNAGQAQIAVDPSGRALAVWQESDGAVGNIWSNRYLPGTGWGTPVLLETDNRGSANNPQIAMDASGSAIAVWYQSIGPVFDIYVARFE